MKLFARACLISSIALIPIACSDDESSSGPGREDAAALCGNGTVDENEECDTEVDVTETCSGATMGSRPEGSVTCGSSCTLDTSGCTAAGGSGGTGGAGVGGTGIGGTMGGTGGDGGGAGDAGSAGEGGTAGSSGSGGAPDAGDMDASMDGSMDGSMPDSSTADSGDAGDGG